MTRFRTVKYVRILVWLGLKHFFIYAIYDISYIYPYWTIQFSSIFQVKYYSTLLISPIFKNILVYHLMDEALLGEIIMAMEDAPAAGTLK